MTTINHSDYAERFNSEAFALVEAHVMTHIFGFTLADPIEREIYLAEDRPSNILESVKRVAMQMIGVSGAKNGLQRLVVISLIEQLPLPTIEAITAFLRHFRQSGDTAVDDYLNIIKTLYHLDPVVAPIQDAIQSASTLHGDSGQLVYELLTSAQHLVLTAQAVLKNDPRYADEKFRVAQTHMEWSKQLAQQSYPDIFPAPDVEPA